MSTDPENDPRQGDLQYNLLWKILNRLENVSGGGGGGGSPGGVNGSVQFKTGTTFDGASNFLYDSGTGLLTVPSISVNGKIILNAVGSAAFASGGLIIDASGNLTAGLSAIHIDGSASFANASTVLHADGSVSFLYGATAFNVDGSVDFSGSLDMGSHRIHSVTDPALPQDAATKNYSDAGDTAVAAAAAAAIALKVSKAGDTMTGALDMNGMSVLNEDGSAQFAIGKIFLGSDGSAVFADSQIFLNADGTVVLSNTLDMGAHQILQVSDPTNPQDAATKAYADTKQSALGFTPENVANKDTTTTLGVSNIKYPSQNAVKTYVDNGLATKQNALGYTAEDVANKDTTVTLGTSDTKYPSQNAVKVYVDNGLATKQASLGYTPEDVANKDVDGTLAANSDTKYPSQKAAKTYIDTVPNRLRTASAGSAYTVTATSQKVTFGTTSPTVTIDKPGTYLINTMATVNLIAATFAAGRVLTIKLRRTNNTPADLTSSGINWNIPTTSVVTNTLSVIHLPPLLYTTANSNDLIEVWADVSVLPSAGSMQIAFPTVIQAVRLLTG